MAYGTAILTGTYKTFDDQPAEGVVEIIPNSRSLVDAEGDVILAGRVKVTLDGTGSFTVTLPATDDATVEPATGRQYTVVAKLRHTHLPAVTGVELATGATVDIADVASAPVVDAQVTPGATVAQVEAVEATVATHTARVDNPHGVTKAQVGLGSVDNVSAAALRDRTTHTGTQPAASITGLAPVATSGSKADVGLGNVDNTSDANKPISTATQAALDGKAGLAATKNVFTGKQEINGGFTNSLDTDLWVAGPIRNNPAADGQAIYAQHRVMGDLGGHVHDGIAAEVRATSSTNASAVCGLETTAQVGGAGTLLSDVRSVTSNFVIQADAAGSVTNASVLRSQTIPALPAGFTIGTVYGLYVENQTVGATNYSIYAPTGLSVFGNLTVDSLAKVKGRLDLLGVPMFVRNSSDTGTFFSIGTSGPRWNDAGLQRTTAPTGASKWFQVLDSAGTAYYVEGKLA